MAGAANWGASKGAGTRERAPACAALAKTLATSAVKTLVAASKVKQRRRGMSLSSWLGSATHLERNRFGTVGKAMCVCHYLAGAAAGEAGTTGAGALAATSHWIREAL